MAMEMELVIVKQRKSIYQAEKKSKTEKEVSKRV